MRPATTRAPTGSTSPARARSWGSRRPDDPGRRCGAGEGVPDRGSRDSSLISGSRGLAAWAGPRDRGDLDDTLRPRTG